MIVEHEGFSYELDAEIREAYENDPEAEGKSIEEWFVEGFEAQVEAGDCSGCGIYGHVVQAPESVAMYCDDCMTEHLEVGTDGDEPCVVCESMMGVHETSRGMICTGCRYEDLDDEDEDD